MVERLRDVTCFKSRNSVFDGSWEGSVDAFKTIAIEDCRKLAKKYLSDLLVVDTDYCLLRTYDDDRDMEEVVKKRQE